MSAISSNDNPVGGLQVGTIPEDKLPVKVSDHKTKKVSTGIFGKIKDWYQRNVAPVLDKSWKWIAIGSASVVGVVVTLSLAAIFIRKTYPKSVNRIYTKMTSKHPKQRKVDGQKAKIAIASSEQKHVHKSQETSLSFELKGDAGKQAETVAASKAAESINPGSLPSEIEPTPHLADTKKVEIAEPAKIKEAMPRPKKEALEPNQTIKKPEALKDAINPETEQTEKPSTSKPSFIVLTPKSSKKKKDSASILQTAHSEEKTIDLPKAGKLTKRQLNLKINPLALMPGAKIPEKPNKAIEEAMDSEKTPEKVTDDYVAIHVNRAKGPKNRRPPSKKPAVEVTSQEPKVETGIPESI